MGNLKVFFQENDLPKYLMIFSFDDCIFLPGVTATVTLPDKYHDQIQNIETAYNGIFGIIKPKKDKANQIGVIVKILKIQLSEKDIVLEVRSLGRFRIYVPVTQSPQLMSFDFLKDDNYSSEEVRGWLDILRESFQRFCELKDIKIPDMNFQNASEEVDFLATHIPMTIEDREKILETVDIVKRLEIVIDIVELAVRYTEMTLKIGSSINKDLKEEQERKILELVHMDIHKKLGINERSASAGKEENIIKIYEDKLNALVLPENVRHEAENELDRLARMPANGSEAEVVRTYLDRIISLPWNIYTDDNHDIASVRRILDEDHYGLVRIKNNIIENLAVKIMNPETRGSILCFSGPPGVGKTSIGRSIARSLGRKFYRLSLGGVRDEAEIRGHRKTYIGALPGNILRGIINSGSNNPVFMLDEIDKLGKDFRGDPSAALLEALDPEQNNSFGDHYFGFPYDLSKVMFITTANDLYAIPDALRDRMEIIELPGYTQEEKIGIAENHLLPKQIMAKGLHGKNIKFSKEAIKMIISGYTAEAGVRKLEQRIGQICRKIVVSILEKNSSDFEITDKNIETYLGINRIKKRKLNNVSPGISAGLAWTTVGGTLLYVETLAIKNKQGSIAFTGQLGDVMKESITIAYKFLKAHFKELQIKEGDFFNKNEIHVHLPEGAIPKDGPSAGITVLTALVSLARNKAIKNDLAMTGEITLRGNITAVGGVKEKVLAAYEEGMKYVILPKDNEKDVEDIYQEVKDNISFKFFDNMIEAVNFALED